LEEITVTESEEWEEQEQGVEALEEALYEDKFEGNEQEEADERLTFTVKRSHFFAVLVPLAFLLGLSVGYLFWGRSSAAVASTGSVSVAPPVGEVAAGERTSQENQAAGAAADDSTANTQKGSTSQESSGESGNPQIVRYDVPVDDDPSLGPEDAPITIIEFSDFECPFCQRFHREVFGRLLSAYPNEIRFVYRDFPLTSIHPNAFPAAEAANCARDQGAFWEFHDRLFTEGLGDKAYRRYASELGLDMDAFETCIRERRYKDEVQADLTFAANLGVRSTPTFFINGIAIVGAQPFEVFQRVIEGELAGEFDQ
jgi:protein-disulfide isomerase